MVLLTYTFSAFILLKSLNYKYYLFDCELVLPCFESAARRFLEVVLFGCMLHYTTLHYALWYGMLYHGPDFAIVTVLIGL